MLRSLKRPVRDPNTAKSVGLDINFTSPFFIFIYVRKPQISEHSEIPSCIVVFYFVDRFCSFDSALPLGQEYMYHLERLEAMMKSS